MSDGRLKHKDHCITNVWCWTRFGNVSLNFKTANTLLWTALVTFKHIWSHLLTIFKCLNTFNLSLLNVNNERAVETCMSLFGQCFWTTYAQLELLKGTLVLKWSTLTCIIISMASERDFYYVNLSIKLINTHIGTSKIMYMGIWCVSQSSPNTR